jgi:hypothetical protein
MILRGLSISPLMLPVLAATLIAQPGRNSADVLALIADQVERYYGRAQSLVSTERVLIQTLARDFSEIGRSRRLEYELRVEWSTPDEPTLVPQVTVVRNLMTVNGRAPRPNDEPECMDPKQVSPEPLAMFLRARQSEHTFTWAGTGRVRNRPAVILDYAPRAPGPPTIVWTEKCVSVDVPSRVRGRVWADPQTGEVLRLDERFAGMYEFSVPAAHQRPTGPVTMVIERADSSIRYRAVSFTDPDETLLVPESIETVTTWRNTATPRVRTIQNFSNYRRFVTGARIVENPQNP